MDQAENPPRDRFRDRQPAMKSRENQPIETLRISDRDKAKLIWAIEESSRKKVEASQRRLRVCCTHTDAVLTLIGEGGNRTRLSVLCRDLSRWGASVIHGRYIYPGTRCELEFKTLDGEPVVRNGEIRHIRHVQGLIHNLGIRFDESIDLSDFVELSPEEENQHLIELTEDMPEDEFDESSSLSCRVLVVDDFASDRKLFGYWLSRAGMEVSTVADITTARQRVAESQYDLVVIDGMLGEESGTDLIKKLRNGQFVAPILSVSANDDAGMRAEALAAGANDFLSKPFTSEQLIDKVNSLLGMEQTVSNEPILSEFNDDKEMRPLLAAFARGLSGYVEQLQDANSRNDYETLEEVATTLKGAGSGYGLSPISVQAADVLLSLNDNAADIEKIRQSVNGLIGVMRRVKVR